MFWSPKGFQMHGPIIQRLGDEYHFFTTTAHAGDNDFRNRTVLHAVSKNLLDWERLPDCLSVGPAGGFDGYTLYDIFVIEHNGVYYMHYTGLDTPAKPGQKQVIGLATSTEKIHWQRHPQNPVLHADPAYYEQAVPNEATYQEKDRLRMWFRDPHIYREPNTGLFHMVVGARDAHAHPDVRGCFAWATSRDLVHWTPGPPVYSPGKFHTLECPTLFDHAGRHYVVFLTHHLWGAPFLTADPHNTYGWFYAVSDEGLRGNYRTLDDDYTFGKVFKDNDGQCYSYYGLFNQPPAGEEKNHPTFHPGMAPPKKLRFLDDGRMYPAYDPALERFFKVMDLSPLIAHASPPSTHWRIDAGQVIGKNFGNRSVMLLGDAPMNCVVGATITFLRGERAGLVLRAEGEAGPGWQIVLDRRWKRLEFGLLGQQGHLFARRSDPINPTIELKLAAFGPSLEIYIDGLLMAHELRYRELGPKVGLLVEKAEARFTPLP